MGKIKCTKWGIRYETNSGNGSVVPSPLHTIVDLAVKAGAAVLMYKLGEYVVGTAEACPFFENYVPHMTERLTGIDVSGKVSGLCALLSGAYGAGASSVVLDPSTLKPGTLRLPLINVQISKSLTIRIDSGGNNSDTTYH